MFDALFKWLLSEQLLPICVFEVWEGCFKLAHDDLLQDGSEHSCESSPDSDSFELLNKSDRESSGEEAGRQQVETLQAQSADNNTQEEEDAG